MNTKQLQYILKTCSLVPFSGIFPSDKLPVKKINFPAALLANTDPQSKPGKHWVAFYIDHDGFGEYFDSYGRPPHVQQFSKFLNKNCDDWLHNTQQIQGPLSAVCGQYCLYFLLHRAHDIPLKTILGAFDRKNLVENDQLVTEYINENYDMDFDTYDLDFIVNQISLPDQ